MNFFYNHWIFPKSGYVVMDSNQNFASLNEIHQTVLVQISSLLFVFNDF
jgi:hypothetical protein